jgi:hypothetical protein
VVIFCIEQFQNRILHQDKPIQTLSNALPIPKDLTTILGSFLFKSKQNNLDKSKSKKKKQ